MVAMLIFAPDASDVGRFEDYARKMYPEYTRLNLPTWIIGPALGNGSLMDRPADFLKIWPKRESIRRWRSAEFNPMVDRLANEHCDGRRNHSDHQGLSKPISVAQTYHQSIFQCDTFLQHWKPVHLARAGWCANAGLGNTLPVTVLLLHVFRHLSKGSGTERVVGL